MKVVENTFIPKTNNKMKIKESLKDKITNTYLFIRSWTRFKLFRHKSLGKDEPRTSLMNLIFSDDFKKFDTRVWRIGQPWGLFHPDDPHQYYGSESVSIVNNSLSLKQYYNKRKFSIDGNQYEIDQSVGLVTSIYSFGYGFYKFECKLPKGIGLWPAVWLSCVDSWPPEIDILEAYSDGDGSYKNNLQSNFHYDFNENKKAAGARNHPVYSVDDKLILSCWFTKDFIKIYYNGYLVRQITSDSILNFFRDKKMIIILNNAIREEYKDKSELINQQSEFYIYSVSYWD